MEELNIEQENKILNDLMLKAKKEGIQKIVVGAVIKNGTKSLLLERPKDDFMGGIHELPSGNMEHNETVRESLNREVKEETNLDIKKILKYLGHFDYLSGSGKKARQLNFLIEVADGGEIKLTEHDSFIWADSKHKIIENVTDSVKEILDKANEIQPTK